MSEHSGSRAAGFVEHGQTRECVGATDARNLTGQNNCWFVLDDSHDCIDTILVIEVDPSLIV